MPLADLLSPMIARKALELQAQLPPAQGYLQAQQSLGANPGQITQPTNPAYPGGPAAATQAQLDAAAAKRLAAARAKEKTPGVRANPSIGVEGMPEAYDPRMQTDRYNAYIAAGQKMRGKTGKQGMAEMFKAQYGELMPMPNPGNQTQGEPVAFDEVGRPIYTAPEPPMPLAGRHQNQMLLPPGDVAMRENGMPLDSRGRPTGYLNMLGPRPEAGGPGGLQFADRRPGDLSLDQMKIMAQKDPFARAQLDQMFGQPLQAKDAGDFASYLKTLKHADGSPYTPAEKDTIKQGVKVLRDVQNTEDRTTLTKT